MKIQLGTLIGLRCKWYTCRFNCFASEDERCAARPDQFAVVCHYTVSRNIGIRLSEAATYGLSTDIEMRNVL